MGPSPADDQQFSLFAAENFEVGNILSDTSHFLRPEPHHQLVVIGIVTHVPRDVLLLQSSDPVFETWGPWNRPGPRKRLFVPQVGRESVRVGAKLNLDPG